MNNAYVAFAGLVVCLLTNLSAWAGGIRPLAFPPVSYTSRPIVIDGHLDDWQGVEGKIYRPLDARMAPGEGVLLDSLRHWDLSANIRWTYDTDALYLAISFVNPRPPQSQDTLTIHLATDRYLNLTIKPVGMRVTEYAEVRMGAGPWKALDPVKAGTKAALQLTPEGYTEEIRIPWSMATETRTIPAKGIITALFDLRWSELTPEGMRTLPVALLNASTHTTMNFLTSKAKLGSAGYLANQADWGKLSFLAAPTPITPSNTLDGTTGTTTFTATRTTTVPAIDASLKEWPANGFQTVALAMNMLGSRYRGMLAAQFDADTLYLAGRFSSAIPLHNLARQDSQAGYSGGDALQVRLNDGKRTVNLCTWYDTQAGKPALTADGNDLPNPFLLTCGAQSAYRASGDNVYDLEIAIPWRALGMSVPQIGDTWKVTFQPWWAGLDAEFTVADTLRLQQRGALALQYTVPADGETTLGLYDNQGQLVRWLLQGDYRYAGKNTESWDGLDQWGKPLAAGTYTVKGITHPPLATDYTMTLGNPGTPPWPTPDGTGDWLSDEANPQGVATDGTWVFLAAPGSEKGCAIIAIDEQGHRVWGKSVEFYPRAVSLAVSGEYLYALFSGPELTDTSNRYVGAGNAHERAIILCLDKRTGQLARFSKNKPYTIIATWPYREKVVQLAALRATNGYTPGVYGGQPRYFCNDLGESTSALGIAVCDDRVYVSLYDENKLLVLDTTTAQPVDEIPLAKPVGLYAGNGVLYAVSGTTIVKVDSLTKQTVPVVTKELLAPHSLSMDGQGNLYVSDWGASFQVKVFSPTGQLLRAIGKAGGRPWVGKWDPNGMLVPRGVAVTTDGKLWVAEDDETPKRVSVWDAHSGAFLRDYLGPMPYGGGTNLWIDTNDPSIVNFSGMRYRVDWTKKTAIPLATTIRKMAVNQVFMPNGHGMISAGSRTFTHDGHEYLAVNGYHMVLLLMRKGDIYVPVAAAGGNSRLVTDDGTARQLWDSDLGNHLYRNYYPECFRGHAGDNFSWTDTNADGLVQAEEMRWVKTLSRGDTYDGRQPEWMSFWGAGIAPDWSLFYGGFCRDATVNYRLDVQGWTPDGAPIYDITTAKTLFTTDKPASVSGYYVNRENKLFISYGYEGGPKGVREDQQNVLECRDREGKLLWSIAMPKQLQKKDYHAENIIVDFDIPGIGNVLGTWLWHGNYRPYLLTSDGLFLGTLLEETKLGPQAAWDESFKYYFQLPDGTPYLVNGANDALHVLAIRGLERSTRFTTSLTLTEADVQLAAVARTVPEVRPLPRPIISMSWVNSPPTLDGKLDEWTMDAGVALEDDGGRGAQIALSRDAEHLYLAARVMDTTPLLNKGDDWQKLFITGDCVDLMLASDPNADAHRRAAVVGDERLMLSVFQDQPIAVLYRPLVPGTTQPVQFMAARIDEVKRLTAVQLAVQRGEGFYTMEAAIPLRDLGLAPTETDTLRGDVGIIYSDETGHNRVQRLYYYNKQTTITADLTTEATLQPGEWGPLQLPLGKNLLKNGSFETPFTAKWTDGWMVELQQNGGTAQLARTLAHSGKQSLLLEQTTPVVFTSEEKTLPNWGDFVQAANGGKGGGHVSISQAVPVVGGKKYSFRVFIRTEDFQLERRDPGEGRGYIALTPYIFWQIPGKPASTVAIASVRQTSADWLCYYNTQANIYGVSTPYIAPEGATEAIVSFKWSTVAPDRLPKIWIDDVEFVEITGP